jgi:membrane protease YdiL (CAAX protease family)
MTIEKYKHPIGFYTLTTVIPWVFWFLAAYLSHITPGNRFYVCAGSILGIIGLLSPMVVAFAMILSEPDLRNDLWHRLFNFKTIKPFYLLTTCFLMLSSILLAQAISLIFGYSVNQFNFASKFTFSAGIFPAWFLLFIAPLLEELAWHSYGTDCLRTRFNLFTVSIIFAVFWSLWHFPLSFIKDYYHSNLVASGWIYTLNFIFSLFPYVLLMNWLYYKTGRNIIVAIILHITAGFFNEIFQTHPDSKVIQTLILLVLSVFIVVKERDFFFKQDYLEYD